MTPTRLRECLATIGWSHRELARRLGCDERIVRRWASGTAPIPPQVAIWLIRLHSAHAFDYPTPKNWKRPYKRPPAAFPPPPLVG